MSKFVIIIFPDRQKAEQGREILDQLADEGSMALYATALVGKDPDGKIVERDRKGKGPRGMVLGGLIGGLVGLLGGPPVAALGAAGGAVMGGWRDAMDLGVGFDFLDDVSRELKPGHWAVAAEIDEDFASPLDARMETIGGIVLRSWREEFQDERIVADIENRRSEFARWRSEADRASKENAARIDIWRNEARSKLERATDRAEKRLEQLEEETEARIDALQEQMEGPTAGARASGERRVAELRGEFEARSARLRQAWEQARQELSP